jgi:hypothetical protein
VAQRGFASNWFGRDRIVPVWVSWPCGAGNPACRRLSSRRVRGREIVAARKETKI